MPELEETKRKLYSAGSEDELKERTARTKEIFEKEITSPKPQAETEQHWQPKAPGFWNRWRRPFWITGGIAVSLALGLGVYFLFQEPFDPGKVEIQFVGPRDIEATQTINTRIIIHNKNRLDINRARVKLEASDGVVVITPTPDDLPLLVGTIKKRMQSEVPVKLRVVGVPGQERWLKAILEYSPPGVARSLKTEFTQPLKILRSPIQLSIDFPRLITGGQEITYTVLYENKSDTPYESGELRVSTPVAFKISDVSPRLEDMNLLRWPVPLLEAGQRGEVKIRGNYETGSDFAIVRAEYYIEEDSAQILYADQTVSHDIIPPPLLITQVINEKSGDLIVNEGEDIKVGVEVSNTTDSVLLDIQVELEIQRNLLIDASSLATKQRAQISMGPPIKIRWDKTNFPRLARFNPSQRETFSLSFKVPENIPLIFPDANNLSLSILSRASSPYTPSELGGMVINSESVAAVKLRTRPALRTFSIDQHPVLGVSGPQPLQYGAKAKALAGIEIYNTFNDLDGVVVDTLLPSYVEWQDEFVPKGEDINYDPVTRKLIWNVGRVAAGTGFNGPPRRLVFGVGLTPERDRPSLLNKITLRGKDVFTREDMSLDAEGVKIPWEIID